ncbi:MAG TPA: tRNA lysidine(34) synthetase TilS [Terracidiphilus sp.]|nr:tRNA lysidine(34) synthetase TilS [Terracidiphilus sp.]
MRPKLPIDVSLFRPGLRLAIGLSGGADSVALLRALTERCRELGLVLHAAHLHHGLRGEEADNDLAFSRALAAKLGLPFHEARVDAGATARENTETIEEAARRLRYSWFRQLMASGEVEAVATAHTLDDQAETVLAKFLRGAWTEGLSGIHPVIEFPEGRILRPLLSTTRSEVEAYLRALGQDWCEDSSNRHLTFTRNRIRHELLPLLEGWNPQLREHLAQMATLARDEEAWWLAELARLGPQILLSGRPARGRGRSAGDGLALDVTRLAVFPMALQRRLLRFAVEKLGSAVDFPATEALRTLALTGRAGQKLELAQGLRAERTGRELRLVVLPVATVSVATVELAPEYTVTIPGDVAAPAFGFRLKIEVDVSVKSIEARSATLRNWKPGDRVQLRHSSGPRKVKEVLERLKVTGSSRTLWPVLELNGRIVWMQGVEVEPESGIRIHSSNL